MARWNWNHAALTVGRAKAHRKIGDDIIRHPDIRTVTSRSRTTMFTRGALSMVAGNKLLLQVHLSVENPEQLDEVLRGALQDFLEGTRLARRLAKELKKLRKEEENG